MTKRTRNTLFDTRHTLHSEDQFNAFLDGLQAEAEDRGQDLNFGNFAPKNFPCIVSAHIVGSEVKFRIQSAYRQGTSVTVTDGGDFLYKRVYTSEPTKEDVLGDLLSALEQYPIEQLDWFDRKTDEEWTFSSGQKVEPGELLLSTASEIGGDEVVMYVSPVTLVVNHHG